MGNKFIAISSMRKVEWNSLSYAVAQFSFTPCREKGRTDEGRACPIIAINSFNYKLYVFNGNNIKLTQILEYLFNRIKFKEV